MLDDSQVAPQTSSVWEGGATVTVLVTVSTTVVVFVLGLGNGKGGNQGIMGMIITRSLEMPDTVAVGSQENLVTWRSLVPVMVLFEMRAPPEQPLRPSVPGRKRVS